MTTREIQFQNLDGEIVIETDEEGRVVRTYQEEQIKTQQGPNSGSIVTQEKQVHTR